MNLDVQDATRTTLEKPTVAYTQELKNTPPKNTSEVYNHIITCNEFNYIKNILQLTPYDTSINCSLTDLIFTKN